MMQASDARVRRTVLAAMGFTALLGIAGLNDGPVAHAMAAAPWQVHDFGVVASRIGLSGYMLGLSAALAIGAVAALRRDRARLLGLPPRLLAERAAFFFVAVAASGLFCQAIKHGLGRARPKLFAEFGAYHFDGPHWAASLDSFPSGHTTTAFLAAVVLSLFLPAGRLVFFTLALLVGLARVLAGAHYPSDVMAGAALGSVAALWLARAFAARNIAFAAASLPQLVVKRATPAWVAP